jgi:8-oxo-dGTP pyrophosphatase MutT (NUDIX family)
VWEYFALRIKMSDKILYTTSHLSLIERDGWYYFAQVPGSPGGVMILLYRTDSELSILGRFEICPAHKDGLALTTIAGGIETGETPIDAIIREAYEEAGYNLQQDEVVNLGQCNLSTNQDTLVYLFAADVTEKRQDRALGDGTRGEQGAYCDWIRPIQAIQSKSAFMSTLMLRLFVKTGITLWPLKQ